MNLENSRGTVLNHISLWTWYVKFVTPFMLPSYHEVTVYNMAEIFFSS